MKKTVEVFPVYYLILILIIITLQTCSIDNFQETEEKLIEVQNNLTETLENLAELILIQQCK